MGERIICLLSAISASFSFVTLKQMDKLIIENHTDKPMALVLYYIGLIMSQGRISKTSKGKQYCFHTSFKNGVEVSAFKNKCSDRFVVHERS